MHAAAYILAGEYDRAEECIFKAVGFLLSFNAELSNLYRRWSALSLARGEHEQAERLVSRALALTEQPDIHGKNLTELGTIHLANGEYSEAIHYLSSAVKILASDHHDRDCSIALHNLNVAMARCGYRAKPEHLRALEPMMRKRARKCNSEFLKIRLQWSRAIVNIHMGRLERAARLLMNIVNNITPGTEAAVAYFDLAEVYWRAGNSDGLAAALERASYHGKVVLSFDQYQILQKMLESLTSCAPAAISSPWELREELTRVVRLQASV